MELAEVLNKLEERDHKIETLLHKVAELASDNRLLRQELEVLRNGTFGAKTERLLPGQLSLFGSGQSLPEPVVPAPQEVKAKPKTKGHGRQVFADHLPREVEHLDLPEEERTCSCCHKEMQCIGEEVTERGHMLPAKVIVKRYVRKKYACPDGHELRTAEAPAGVVPKAKYEVDKNSKVSVYRGLWDAEGLAGQISAGERRVLTANGCC